MANNLFNVPLSQFADACHAATDRELFAFLFEPRESEGYGIRSPRTTGDPFDAIAIAERDARDAAEWATLAPWERTPETHMGG
jgi:hypothetical protein